MKIWIVVLNGKNSYVQPHIDFETGEQMEGDHALADELTGLVPNLGGWNSHIVIRYRASNEEPKISLGTPAHDWAEELIMRAQENRTDF
jgi:hypothetical protein